MKMKQHFSSFHPQIKMQIHNQNQKSEKANYQITEIKELQNENLKSYLRRYC
jgi:hypothetical protein